MRSHFALVLIFAQLVLAGPVFCHEIVLGAEDRAGPWGQPDGTGAGNEIVAAAFDAAGEKVKLEVMPYSRAKAMTLEGTLAGCFAMAWEDQLEGRVVFSEQPLYSVRAVFFENSQFPLGVHSQEGLGSTAALGIVAGYEYPPEVVSLKDRGISFIESSSEEINLKHLAAGRLDSAVLVLDALKNERLILKRAGVEGRVRKVFEAGGQGSYVGFSLENPLGLKAKEIFDRGFAIIRANGTFKAIIERWQKKSR